MPHMILEYSANLEERFDMRGLCKALHAAALESGLFELGALRVRAIACKHFVITDDHPDNAFIDIAMRVNRASPEARKVGGAKIFEAARVYLAALLAQPHFALSMEIRAIDPELSWRENAMQARLRG